MAVMSRRIRLVGVALGVAAALGVAPALPAAGAPPGSDVPACAPGVDLLGFSDALDKTSFAGTDVGGLSALAPAWQRGAYHALLDNQASTPARFYTARIPVDRGRLGTPEIVDVTLLRDGSGEPFTGETFDGEGLVRTLRGAVVVSSETEPSIRRFTIEGALLGELAVPDRFRVRPAGQADPNMTFESLSSSQDGRSLFTAVEGPLASDGSTADGSHRIRILRYGDRGPGGLVPAEQFFYLAEPGQGVVEILALSEHELLVLERGFQPGAGNTVRMFRVSLRGAGDVSDEPTLAAPELEPVPKRLLVDIADCPPGDAESPGTQANPLLDNYESLTFGPRLPGGRRALLLVSDDNFNDVQVTRVLALSVRL